jgi:uncharacterized protein HemX
MKHNELEEAFQQAAEKTENIKQQLNEIQTQVEGIAEKSDADSLGGFTLDYAQQVAETGIFAQYVEEFGIVGATVIVLGGLAWTWMKKQKERSNEIKEMDGREEEKASEEKEVSTDSVQKTESQPPKTQ